MPLLTRFPLGLTLFCLLFFTSANAQTVNKPPLGTKELTTWPYISNYPVPAISEDGKFIMFDVTNLPLGSHTLHIKSVEGRQELRFINATFPLFVPGFPQVLLIKGGDSLCLVNLPNKKIQYLGKTNYFQLINYKNQHLIVFLDAITNALLIKNLTNELVASFQNVARYKYNKKSEYLAMLCNDNSLKENNQVIALVDNLENAPEEIWEGDNVRDFLFDQMGRQLVIHVDRSTSNGNIAEIWFWRGHGRKAYLLADSTIAGLDSNFRLSNPIRFTSDGKVVLCNIERKVPPMNSDNPVKVDVWSFFDIDLQSEQIDQKTYVASISVDSPRLVRLQYEKDFITLFDDRVTNLGFIHNFGSSMFFKRFWMTAIKPKFSFISLKTAAKTSINLSPIVGQDNLAISPSHRFIVLTDSIQSELYSFEFNTSKILCITEHLPVPKIDKSSDVRNRRGVLKIAGWLDDGYSIVVNDGFDLWIVTIGEKPRFSCLTNQYGRKNNIVFSFMTDKGPDSNNVVNRDNNVILSAFNLETKQNGFFSVRVNNQGDPVPLTMDDCVYYADYITPGIGRKPIKANRSDVWLVCKSTAAKSQNLFTTKDFKTFNQLTYLHPESKYNWLKSRLFEFKTEDGRNEKAILYLPENFDSARSYPVVFHYYEMMSDNLNVYMRPEPCYDNINIPWLVSNGYIVCTPDIHYKWGHAGKSALQSVEGAADYLSKFNWIDTSKFGLQGHSLGGFETNYIVTHSNRFRAAMSSAGVTNMISQYNSIMRTGTNLQDFAPYRMGATLWERPDLYIDNSPVMFADRVSTPLLMMNNKEDDIVVFAQGLELFLALRRLNKPVWMLQYDNVGHSFTSLEDPGAVQHSVRILQFFDHYLRGKLPPFWMTNGVPASKKGIEYGLELDSTDSKPVNRLMK